MNTSISKEMMNNTYPEEYVIDHIITHGYAEDGTPYYKEKMVWVYRNNVGTQEKYTTITHREVLAPNR